MKNRQDKAGRSCRGEAGANLILSPRKRQAKMQERGRRATGAPRSDGKRGLALVLLLCVAGCLTGPFSQRPASDPSAASSSGAERLVSQGAPGALSGPALRERLGEVLSTGAGFSALQSLLTREKARGEEARGLLLLEALFATSDGQGRDPLLLAVADVTRPQRVGYLDQQLGLTPTPTELFSSAAPAALRTLATALVPGPRRASQKVPPPDDVLAALLREAQGYSESGQFLEAAGALTLAQAIAARGAQRSDTTAAALAAARDALEGLRRCEARLLDAARPPRDRRPLRDQRGQLRPALLPPAQQVAQVLREEPQSPVCAVRLLHLLTARDELGPFASPAARALLQPAISADEEVTPTLLPIAADAPPPLLRGDPAELRATVQDALLDHLWRHPERVPPLLAELGHEPRPALFHGRRDDVLLAVLFRAPPQVALVPRLFASFARHNPVVADPPRYIAYLGQLPAESGKAQLMEALGAEDDAVLSEAVVALGALEPQALETVLREPLRGSALSPPSPEEQRRFRARVGALRALFRLPPADLPAPEQRAAWSLALELHRCCRGDAGSCQRRALTPIARCPAWLPLRGF